MLPKHLQTLVFSDRGRNRTFDLLVVTQMSLPLDHAIIFVESSRQESNLQNHKPLMLAAFPVCVLDEESRGSGGRTRRSWLMRPGRALAHPQRFVHWPSKLAAAGFDTSAAVLLVALTT